MSVIQPIATSTHPVVLRFAELFPAQLAGYQMHGERQGGDLSHIDGDRSHLNRILIGPEDWREKALAEIDVMRHENLVEELEALKARGRTKEMDARAREGLKDPWRASKGGPLREVILTASKDWFEAPSSRPSACAAATEAPRRVGRRATPVCRPLIGVSTFRRRAGARRKRCG